MAQPRSTYCILFQYINNTIQKNSITVYSPCWTLAFVLYFSRSKSRDRWSASVSINVNVADAIQSSFYTRWATTVSNFVIVYGGNFHVLFSFIFFVFPMESFRQGVEWLNCLKLEIIFNSPWTKRKRKMKGKFSSFFFPWRLSQCEKGQLSRRSYDFIFKW